jgi:Lrp/AsnC family transcriptional regulator for asnA, asnC and gidA
MSQLDYIDEQIVEQLKKDARIPFSKIADTLKISNSLVHQRVKKMKEDGVILKTDIVLDEKAVGYHTKCYTGIRLKEAHYADHVVKSLEKIEEVVECNFVSGKFALFILVFAKDNDHLRHVLYEKIHKIEGVGGTDTFISFTTNFKRSISLNA